MERIFCHDGRPVIRFFQVSVVVSWAAVPATYSELRQILCGYGVVWLFIHHPPFTIQHY